MKHWKELSSVSKACVESKELKFYNINWNQCVMSKRKKNIYIYYVSIRIYSECLGYVPML